MASTDQLHLHAAARSAKLWRGAVEAQSRPLPAADRRRTPGRWPPRGRGPTGALGVGDGVGGARPVPCPRSLGRRRRPAAGRRLPAIWDGDRVELRYPITNADRSVGTALSGAISLEYGADPPPGPPPPCASTARPARASARSSATGIELELVGEANDYVGKGMAGGRIVVRPPADDARGARPRRPRCSPATRASTAPPAASCSWPARVGERFAVRNSGAVAVVEARRRPLLRVHDRRHGRRARAASGYNLGAGMTGGQAVRVGPRGRAGGHPGQRRPGRGAAARPRGPRGAPLAASSASSSSPTRAGAQRCWPIGTSRSTSSGTSSPAPVPTASPTPPAAGSPPPDRPHPLRWPDRPHIR